MTCNEARVAMDALLDGELGTAGEETLRGHLASCAACAREMGERRAFSASLLDSFDRALEDVKSTPADRHWLVERMLAASRRRALFPARLAAAVMVGLAVGIAAYAAGLFGPRTVSPDRRELADLISRADVRARQIDLLTQASMEDLQKAHEAAAREAENPAVRLASLQLSHFEELLASGPVPARSVADLVAATASSDIAARGAAKKSLRQLPSERLDELKRAAANAAGCDQVYVGQVISEIEDRGRQNGALAIVITQSEDGKTVEFRQHGNGRVEVTVPGFKAEARSVRDLLSRHPDVCRRFGIAGREGAVVVGDRAAAVDLGGQVNLMFRTGDWHEGLQWEAYRAWIAGRVRDAAEVDRKVNGLRERCLQAAQLPPVPEVKVDVQAVVQGVRKMTEEQLRENRRRLEERMKELQARLQQAQEFRARARGLRVYAETVAEEK